MIVSEYDAKVTTLYENEASSCFLYSRKDNTDTVIRSFIPVWRNKKIELF